jgi:hypothetical protein
MQQPSLLFDEIITQNQSGLSNTDYLKELTKKYPFFTAAQFYLLQQTNQSDSNYNHQAAKTALLFNNPFWLHFQLQQSNSIANTIIQTPVVSMYSQPLNTQAIINESDSVPEPIIVSSYNNASTLNTEIITNPTVDEIAANDTEALNDEQDLPPIKIDIASSLNQAITDGELTFEPMHRVDYFASQGIKLKEEVQPADKLGQQLKSFTQWLKTMKKTHVAETEANSGIADMVIQTLAAKSNTEGEIVTEAMAEVLMQQGKTAKAIEVYKKLSLLNPLKSAFFAAKIEQLKEL